MLVTDLPQDRNSRFVSIRRPLIALANRCRHTVALRPLLRAQLTAILDELDRQDEAEKSDETITFSDPIKPLTNGVWLDAKP